jgi:23S rRNA pseudouridine2605 synthase
MERLQKVIASSGYCSRRKAEDLIINSKVMVNGRIVNELGVKVKGDDVIKVENNVITREEKEYYVINKPRGVLSTTKDDKDRKTIIDYIETDKRIYPVGRLDYDTTGLLLLTNDGEFANNMMKPSSMIEKTYLAKINGILTKEEKQKLLSLKKYKVDNIKVKSINKTNQTSLVEITIHEGKNHEIKNIFKTINYDTLKLTRISYGFLDIKDLKSGEYRKLNIKEVKKLYSLIKK